MFSTFKPTADAYVDATKPKKNFGSRPALFASANRNVSYLRFKVGGLVDRVKKARLRLYSRVESARGLRLHEVAGAGWSELGITWKNRPGIRRAFASARPIVSGAWASVDVTSFLTSKLNERTRRGRRPRRGIPRSISIAVTAPNRTVTSYGSREALFTSAQLVVESARTTGAPVVAAVGDIACDTASRFYNGGLGDGDHCRMMATSDLLMGRALTRVLTLGDNQYERGEISKFQRSYDTTWGRVKSITRPAVGNHEWDTREALGHFAYFGGAAGAGNGIYYYSYDLGSWHIIALDSTCKKVLGGCGVGSPQEQWLRNDLSTHSASCTLAYWHHPRFDSSFLGGRAELGAFWQDLYDFGADVVLTSHAHNYQRLLPLNPEGEPDAERGIREFIVGTGGKDHGGFQTTRSTVEVRNTGTFGVLFLTLEEGGYSWEFVPEKGEEFVDSGRGQCH
ncbi:MAG: DNRLRE domain-containing protein [Actinomycetota bacterium]|nr:DNRLRE domain-containing protein [Actinomycetota bacterium]